MAVCVCVFVYMQQFLFPVLWWCIDTLPAEMNKCRWIVGYRRNTKEPVEQQNKREVFFLPPQHARVEKTMQASFVSWQDSQGDESESKFTFSRFRFHSPQKPDQDEGPVKSDLAHLCCLENSFGRVGSINSNQISCQSQKNTKKWCLN